MDYVTYTVEHFVADDSFQAYVHRTNAEDVAFWEEWITRHPHKAEEVADAYRIVSSLVFKKEELNPFEFSRELERLQAMLQTTNNGTAASGQRMWTVWRGIAAAVLLLMVATLTFWFLNHKSAVNYQTRYGEKRKMILPDGSVVFLNSNSSLRFSEDWDKQPQRDVWLEGEAYFEVKPLSNPTGKVKFLVHSGPVNVEVVGTRFNVWNRNKQVKVVLNSGKVNLSIHKKQSVSNVAMVPGDVVVLQEDGRSTITRTSKPDNFSAWKDNHIVLDNMPIREVASVIKEYYGLEVKWQDEHIAAMKVSGTLPTDNEQSFLKALSIILNLKVTREKNQVTFAYK